MAAGRHGPSPRAGTPRSGADAAGPGAPTSGPGSIVPGWARLVTAGGHRDRDRPGPRARCTGTTVTVTVTLRPTVTGRLAACQPPSQAECRLTRSSVSKLKFAVCPGMCGRGRSPRLRRPGSGSVARAWVTSTVVTRTVGERSPSIRVRIFQVVAEAAWTLIAKWT